MMQLTPEELLKDRAMHRMPIALPEVKIMLKIIKIIGLINLLIGLPSLVLLLNMHSISLALTGILAIFTFRLMNMLIKHIYQTQSWAEVGIIVMCGVYFPSCIMWISAENLLEAILR